MTVADWKLIAAFSAVLAFGLGAAAGDALSGLDAPTLEERSESRDQQQRRRCVTLCGDDGVRRFERSGWGGDLCECRNGGRR